MGGAASLFVVGFDFDLKGSLGAGIEHEDVDVLGVAQGHAGVVAANGRLRKRGEFAGERDGVFGEAGHWWQYWPGGDRGAKGMSVPGKPLKRLRVQFRTGPPG